MDVRDFVYMVEGETDGNVLYADERIVFVTPDERVFEPVSASSDGSGTIVVRLASDG